MRRSGEDGGRAETRSALPGVAVGLVAAVILFGTLLPAGPPGEEPTMWCGTSVICGTRGMADAVVNIFLFLPFGAALRTWLRSTSRSVVVAVLFSMAIETTQLFVPGRMTSVGDVIFNGLGGAIGTCLVATAPVWLYPSRRIRAWLAGAALAAALGVVFATGLGVRAALPAPPYWVQWTPTPPSGARYRGRVLSATLAGDTLRVGVHDASRRLRRRITAGSPLSVRFVLGPAPSSMAPLVRIVTGYGDDVAQLAVIGTDLVFDLRRHGIVLRMHDPSIIFPDALAHAKAGDVETVRIWKARDGTYCVSSTSLGRSLCGGGFTAGRGWAFLLGDESMSTGLRRLFDGAWLLFVFFPVGVLAGSVRITGALTAASTAGLFLLPYVSGLLPTPPTELASGVLGILLGAAVRASVIVARHRSMRSKAASNTSDAPPNGSRTSLRRTASGSRSPIRIVLPRGLPYHRSSARR